MARIRTIKPEFFTSENIVALTPLSRLFYVSLWLEADREGRLEWKPKTFKLRYFPADDCDIETMGKELIDAGLIVLYEDDKYAEIPSFAKHQVINNRESESEIPARVKEASPRVQAEGRKEGKEGKGTRVVDATESRFPEFWTAWPPTDRKQDKAKCQEKWRKEKLDGIADKILEHVAAQRGTRKWQDGFEPAPLTYLNGKRWEDGTGNQSAKAWEGAI